MSILTQESSHCLAILAVLLLVHQYSIRECASLHLQGTWDPDERFFLFLAKFGFQKTELASKNNTQGFIFGNITAVPNVKGGFAGGGRIARLPSIPPAALIPKSSVPKVRVPRGVLNRTSTNDTSSSSVTPKPSQASPTGEAAKATASDKPTSKHNTLENVNASTPQKSTVPPPAPAPAPPQIVGSHSKGFAETFVQLSKSSLPSVQVNFSSIMSSASNKTSPSSSPPPVLSSSTSTTTSTTTTTPKPSTASTKSSTMSGRPSSSTTSKVPSSKSTSTTLAPAPPLPTQIYPATLVVLDRGFFLDFYKNRLEPDRNLACKRMFERIAHVVHDPYCYPEGTENLLRRVPCPKGEVCPDDKAVNHSVVKENQLTYAISDLSKAKFWYVSLVPCYRNPITCEWQYSKNITPIDYDMYLVNGNPYTKNQNPLEYQFSFDRQDTVEIYLVFFLCYLILVPLQIHAVLRQRHIVPKLFTASVALELLAVTSNVIHVLKFAVNGEGHPRLAAFGDVTDIIARAMFMLILLVLAKGWAVTRTELTSKPFIFSIWAAYGVVHVLLYVWKETEVDVIEDIDEYQTWPGWLILVLRTLIMIWFLYELKDTMDHEHQPHKLNFFLHFGAAALVWFIYLPIVALIALQVSPLWRSKFLLGITYSADCLGFAIMTHLLWPTRTEQYFLLMSKEAVLNDELEEFNEAPHVVNSYVRRPNQWYPVNYSFHDVSSPEAVSLTQGNTIQNLNHQYPHQRFTSGTNGLASDDVKDNVPLIIT